MTRIADVLFADKGTNANGILFKGMHLRAEVPVVLCGKCGRGLCMPIVNQSCSANCGAYVYEVVMEGSQPSGKSIESPGVSRELSAESEAK